MAKILGNVLYKQVLVTYDLQPMQEKAHVRFMNLLRSKGYQDWICGTNAKGEEGKTYLPGCTLWKANIAPKDAKTELRETAKFCGAVIVRCIVAEIFEWSGMTGKPVRADVQAERL